MTETLAQLASTAGTWGDVILGAIGFFALVATTTPNKSDDKIVQMFYDAVNFLGANIGKAANPKE